MSQQDPSIPKKSKKFRWLVRIVLGGAVLLVALVITAVTIAKSYINPDFIAAQIEAENNCRVEIAATELSLFSFPARIELKGVKIAERDPLADAGTKLADRPPLVGIGVINADSIVLEANLLDMILRKISLKHLTIDKLYVSEFLIEREGGSSLDKLFDPPATVNGSPNPEFEEKKRRRDLARERRKLSKEERGPVGDTPFTITELPLPATMQAFNINDASVNAKIRRNKTRITFSDVQVKVSDIDLDPGDLEKHNQAKVTVSGHLDVEDRDRTVKYADLDIISAGEVIPFDPITGYLNPDLTYEITVRKGSKLDAVPSLIKLASKIEKFNDYGLKLKALGNDVLLEEDTTITLGYREDALLFTEPVNIRFDGHLLTLKAGAWLHTGSNRHEAEAEVLLSKSASDQALGEARQFLAEKAKKLGLGGDTVQRYADKLLEPVTKDGQIWIPFTSDGDLNDPDVEPTIDYESLAETMAIELLGDLLDKAQKDASKGE